MRLGTSGLGVIAVVSFLVTAAPERDDSGGNNRGSSIDHSTTGGSESTSRTRYSWPSQVATETSSSSSSFVKIELENPGSTSPEASRGLPHPSLVPLVRHTNREAEIPTALANSFTSDLPVSHRAFVEPRNFLNAAIPPDVRSSNTSPSATLEDNRSLDVDSSVPISESAISDIQENLLVGNRTFSSSLSFLRLRRSGNQTSSLSRITESQDNLEDLEDKRSTSYVTEATKENRVESDVTRSASTMNQGLTTMTTRPRFPGEDFRNSTKRYEVKISRDIRESKGNKETTEASNGQPHFHNSQVVPNAFLKSSGKILSKEANSTLHSEAHRFTNYSAKLRPTVHFGAQNVDKNENLQKVHSEIGLKRLTPNEMIDKPANHSEGKANLVGKTMREVEVALSDDSFVRENLDESSVTRSAGTINQRLTTVTTRRSFSGENFHNSTKRHDVKMSRGTRESTRNKEPTETSNGQPHFHNSQGEPNAALKSSSNTFSKVTSIPLHSEAQRFTNYSANLTSTVHYEAHNADMNERLQRDHTENVPKRLTANETIDKPANDSDDKSILVGKRMRKVEIALSDDSLIRDDATVEQQALTVKSIVDILARKPETHSDSSVTEEIARAWQITSESSLEIPTIESPLLRFTGSVANTSEAYVAALLDNHKAMRVRSFQTVRSEQHQQQRALSLGTLSVPSRLPYDVNVKDNADSKDSVAGIERPVVPVNQLTIPKSAYPVAKNLSKASINLLDGKPKKKYYEIKPSLITEMDHGTNLEVTTTPRRSFDKFLLPSVPSAIGKFGPYFIDEEDRRNVTERIGNTVQLDCRIGMLGLRKVTWLQHYKDSFRLLTVERESYSVDRRISLNYQYPNNWRLQIAYASLRDSGLYKCQVEIDQDKSLVKRYNVIITAPILTITDDSGRPVSGERHLKAGSALKLRCEARDIMQRLNESVLWMRGDETLTKDVSENRTTEIENEKEITVVVSTLLVEYALPKHAGNYSCVVPEKARTTIAVHVLNGELPAAVQHGSGVSTAVLNLWLIHLTASYGFFR